MTSVVSSYSIIKCSYMKDFEKSHGLGECGTNENPAKLRTHHVSRRNTALSLRYTSLQQFCKFLRTLQQWVTIHTGPVGTTLSQAPIATTWPYLKYQRLSAKPVLIVFSVVESRNSNHGLTLVNQIFSQIHNRNSGSWTCCNFQLHHRWRKRGTLTFVCQKNYTIVGGDHAHFIGWWETIAIGTPLRIGFCF